MSKDANETGGDDETVFRTPGGSVRGPKGSRNMIKIAAVVMSLVCAGTAGGYGVKDYVQKVEQREAERAEFEDTRYNKLANGLDNLLHAVNELKTELRVGAAQKADTDRRFAAVEAELKVQSALWAALSDKYVRREDFERVQRELQRALQDIAELKAKIK